MIRSLFVLVPLLALGADWPQWRGVKRDNHWGEKGLPEKLPEKLSPRWKKSIGGGYGGIAVSSGRVFVMDRHKEPSEVERVVCFDAKTGKELWVHKYTVSYGKLDYGNGPRTTPTVHNGKVYTLGALGHLCCLDEKTGKPKWTRDTGKDFTAKVPMWGHACSPLVEGKTLIVQVGGKGACLVALDLETGKDVWRVLDDPAGYCSPVIVDTGKWRQLVFFTPKAVVGLDPARGKELWRVSFKGITYGVAISDIVYADGVILAGNYWSGSKGIKLNDKGLAPKVAWESEDLCLLMATPLIQGKHAYALDKKRGLVCLEMASGKVLWEGKHVTPRDRNPHASMAWIDGKRALILNTPGELKMVELSPRGLTERGKVSIIARTWAHAGFGDRCVFARTDKEIVCVPLVGK